MAAQEDKIYAVEVKGGQPIMVKESEMTKDHFGYFIKKLTDTFNSCPLRVRDIFTRAMFEQYGIQIQDPTDPDTVKVTPTHDKPPSRIIIPGR